MARKRKRSGITEQEKEFAAFFGHNFVRSKKAREVDNATTKGLTDNFSKFWNDPSRNDFRGIDTQVRIKPKGFTKEKGKRAFEDIEEMFGKGGFR